MPLSPPRPRACRCRAERERLGHVADRLVDLEVLEAADDAVGARVADELGLVAVDDERPRELHVDAGPEVQEGAGVPRARQRAIASFSHGLDHHGQDPDTLSGCRPARREARGSLAAGGTERRLRGLLGGCARGVGVLETRPDDLGLVLRDRLGDLVVEVGIAWDSPGAGLLVPCSQVPQLVLELGFGPCRSPPDPLLRAVSARSAKAKPLKWSTWSTSDGSSKTGSAATTSSPASLNWKTSCRSSVISSTAVMARVTSARNDRPVGPNSTPRADSLPVPNEATGVAVIATVSSSAPGGTSSRYVVASGPVTSSVPPAGPMAADAAAPASRVSSNGGESASGTQLPRTRARGLGLDSPALGRGR